MPAGLLNLGNLGGGAVAEQFDDALQRVLENIADPNTDWKAARVVQVSVRFVPKEDRKRLTMRYAVTTRLTPTRTFECDAVLGDTPNGLAAREIGTSASLFDETGAPAANVEAPPKAAEPAAPAPPLRAVANGKE